MCPGRSQSLVFKDEESSFVHEAQKWGVHMRYVLKLVYIHLVLGRPLVLGFRLVDISHWRIFVRWSYVPVVIFGLLEIPPLQLLRHWKLGVRTE